MNQGDVREVLTVVVVLIHLVGLGVGVFQKLRSESEEKKKRRIQAERGDKAPEKDVDRKSSPGKLPGPKVMWGIIFVLCILAVVMRTIRVVRTAPLWLAVVVIVTYYIARRIDRNMAARREHSDEHVNGEED